MYSQMVLLIDVLFVSNYRLLTSLLTWH